MPLYYFVIIMCRHSRSTNPVLEESNILEAIIFRIYNMYETANILRFRVHHMQRFGFTSLCLNEVLSP